MADLMFTDSQGGATDHRDHEDNEGEARQPQVPEGAVLQLTRPLGCGLEGDHTAEQLGSDCSPACLHTQQPCQSCMPNVAGTNPELTS